MKKKFMTAIAAALLLVSLTGCYGGGSVFAEPAKGTLQPVPNRDCLYYDLTTKNVYVMYREFNGNQGYGYMSAYYAPNGLPYLYDISTNSLVENTN